MVYNDFNSFMAAINKKVNTTVKNEVTPNLKQEIADKAKTNVYDVYEPTMYKRRHTLDNPDNYKISQKGGKTTIKFTKDHDTSIWKDIHRNPFIDWIEKGYVPNYFNYDHYVWMEPRPFVSEVMNKDNVRQEVVSALRNKGYHVK